MSEHDRLEYWTATTAPITPENINGVINSLEWDSLPEDDKKFFLEVQKVVLDPAYMIPPPFYGLKTSQDKAEVAL